MVNGLGRAVDAYVRRSWSIRSEEDCFADAADAGPDMLAALTFPPLPLPPLLVLVLFKVSDMAPPLGGCIWFDPLFVPDDDDDDDDGCAGAAAFSTDDVLVGDREDGAEEEAVAGSILGPVGRVGK